MLGLCLIWFLGLNIFSFCNKENKMNELNEEIDNFENERNDDIILYTFYLEIKVYFHFLD